jgi:transposase
MTAVEVITSVERRRRWSREDKLRIVAESARPEGTVSQVARAHGIAPSQLFTWRRQLLAAAIGGCEAASGFVPVQVTADPASAAPARVGQPSSASSSASMRAKASSSIERRSPIGSARRQRWCLL